MIDGYFWFSILVLQRKKSFFFLSWKKRFRRRRRMRRLAKKEGERKEAGWLAGLLPLPTYFLHAS